MNHFSDKEYQNLKADTAEVRSCITRYIGYIITVTGFSGFVKFYFNQDISPSGTLTLFFIAMTILTFLFEVVWYKFKSHNRLIGYMQLLMQEIHAIPYKNITLKKHWKDKEYIKKYQEYEVTAEDKGIQHYFGWEFVMSRLNGNQVNKFRSDEDERKAYTKALDKSNFIFSLPTQLIPFTETLDCVEEDGKKVDRDVDFFNKIIYPLYKQDNSIPLGSNLFKYFQFMYRKKEKSPMLESPPIEKRYYVYGWEYPRKITQIAFASFGLIYLFSLYFLIKQFGPADFTRFSNLAWGDWIGYGMEIVLPVVLLLASSSFLVFWIRRYVKELPELIYGKFSIDYYCWMFFLYRIQMMNSKKLVPIFYSRSYIRYFKGRLYYLLAETNKEELKKLFPDTNAAYLLSTYQSKLNAHSDFEKGNVKNLHKAFKKAFKKMNKNPKEHPNYEISDTLLKKVFQDVFEKVDKQQPKM